MGKDGSRHEEKSVTENYSRGSLIGTLCVSLLVGVLVYAGVFYSNAESDEELKASQKKIEESLERLLKAETEDGSGLRGYVAVHGSAIMFISWTETRDGYLTGSLWKTWLENAELTSTSRSFDGLRSGASISITFPGNWLEPEETWTGTLKDNTLTLAYPARGGELSALVFEAGDVEVYDALVEKAQKIVAIAGALDRLKADVSRLARVDFDDILRRYESNWKEMQENWTELQQEASARPLTDVELSYVESCLGYLEADLGYFESANASMESRVKRTCDLITRVENDIAALRDAWEDYESLGCPGGLFRPEEISQAVSRAQDCIRQTKGKISTAQNTAGAYYTKAQELFAEAQSFVADLKSSAP